MSNIKEDSPSIKLISSIPNILPHNRVFPIQIGSELFKLSGASISSDAPSYFSQYFQCQIKVAEDNGDDVGSAIRTLYIDRDPVTFKDISLHLQGYHVQPRDGTHFVRLFADAQFYSLPKLISQLYEESIFISIGHREFQIPRDLFSDPGNSPNFFSLGFGIFFSNPEDLFPGLDREGLIRPPSIMPPSVPNRSADTFAEILKLLRGYPVQIRNETHRSELLRDCRYFNFKGLEQKLIPHAISFNQARRRDEIVLRLEDILKSGISVMPDAALPALPATSPASMAAAISPIGGSLPLSDFFGGAPLSATTPGNGASMSMGSPPAVSPGWVHYARPFVDDRPYELVLEIGGESTKLHVSYPSFPSSSSNSSSSSSPHAAFPSLRAEFFRDTRARIARLFEVICTKLNLPPTTQPLGLLMATGGASSQPATPGNTPLSEDLVRVVLEPGASVIILDGRPWSWNAGPTANAHPPALADADDVTILGGGVVVGRPGRAASVASSVGSPVTTSKLEGGAGGSNPAGGGAGAGGGVKRRRIDSAGGAVAAGHVHTTALAVPNNVGGVGNAGAVAPVPGSEEYWLVRTAQWRLRIQPARNRKSAVECVLVAVRVDAVSSEYGRNERRAFLSG